MRKIIVLMHTGYRGSDAVEVVEVKDNVYGKDLHEMAWEMVIDHASSYGYDTNFAVMNVK